MLSQLRRLEKTPFASVLLGLVLVSFVVWGIRGVSNGGGFGDSVIRAGGRSISALRFKQLFADQLQQYDQQSGQTLTVQDAAARGADRQALDSLASEEALAAYVQQIGIRPSDQEIVAEISKAPRFFNPVTGAFDKDAYKTFVQGLGLTDAEFENILRDQLAQTQFISGMATGLRAPQLFSALQAAFAGEGRSFSYFVLPPDAVPAPATPSDAQMTSFLKEHAPLQPETRVFTVAAFSSAKRAETLPADPAEVQKRFDFEKDTLSTPEKRTLVEIPVPNASEGQAVAARLAKGEEAQAVAKSLNVQPVVYTDSPKTAVADKKVADAAFAMTVGQVKGPVQGDLGLAVIKLTGITPGHQETLDEARLKIEQEVKLAAAQADVNKAVQAYEAQRSGGASLPDAAKAAGAVVTTLPAITAQATTLQRQQVNMPPKLLEAGFALKPGQDSDIVDLGQGEYAALRLDKVNPPAPPALDQVRPELQRYLMQQDLMKRLQAKAETIAAAIRKGQTLQAAAAANHAAVQQATAVTRGDAGKTFNAQLLSPLFLAKPGEVVTGPDMKPGFVVANLQAVVPATPATAAQAAANGRAEANQDLSQDVATAVRAAAREAIKPKVDYARAHQALVGGA